MYIKNNKNRYKVNTPNGWSDFSGLNIIKKSRILEIIFSNNKKIQCSEDHIFFKNNSEIKCKCLTVGDFIDGRDNKKIEIKKISKINKETKLYDLMDVEKNNIYYTDDLISHNCEFLGSAGTLISSYALKNQMIFTNPLEVKFDQKFNIYAYPEDNKQYLLMIDPGEGLDQDYSTIQVLDITTDITKQIAVFRDNKISTQEFPFIIDQISKMYNNALIIGENNLYGEVLNDLNYDLECNVFYDKKFGIRMTTKSKRIGCAFLKRNIENNLLEISDFETISEFGTFIKQGNSFEADTGYHDDLITPLILFSYFIKNKEWVENWIDDYDVNGNLKDFHKKVHDDLLPAGYVNDGSDILNLEN
jgi:hypothetical protein